MKKGYTFVAFFHCFLTLYDLFLQIEKCYCNTTHNITFMYSGAADGVVDCLGWVRP